MVRRPWRAWTLAVLLLFPSGAVAMGFPGGEAPGSIPKPTRDFVFSVIDQQGVETRLREFSIEGSLYLSGHHGKGKVAMPFERIRAVRLRAAGDELHARAELVDGTTADLVVNGRNKCYGRMDYGNFQIELRDVEKLVNQGETPR
ncbi:MAG TPA: hypothetical protein VEI04_05915 [Syntrophobacteria bacterium]|nr:hypothetical protein [Syntrophobacteria bacterium]